jgi:hypothetical protein
VILSEQEGGNQLLGATGNPVDDLCHPPTPVVIDTDSPKTELALKGALCVVTDTLWPTRRLRVTGEPPVVTVTSEPDSSLPWTA